MLMVFIFLILFLWLLQLLQFSEAVTFSFPFFYFSVLCYCWWYIYICFSSTASTKRMWMKAIHFELLHLLDCFFYLEKEFFFLLSLFDSIQCFPFSSLLFRRFSIYIHCFPVVCTIKNAAKKRTHVFVRTMKDLSICVTRYLR